MRDGWWVLMDSCSCCFDTNKFDSMLIGREGRKKANKAKGPRWALVNRNENSIKQIETIPIDYIREEYEVYLQILYNHKEQCIEVEVIQSNDSNTNHHCLINLEGKAFVLTIKVLNWCKWSGKTFLLHDWLLMDSSWLWLVGWISLYRLCIFSLELWSDNHT